MKIEQQIYTRERRGMFRQSEGYDTIAASPGLTDVFIKESLHPYCTYSPSPIDRTCRSRAITIAHYSCGRMLLGQAVYVPVDFTGQRATFFVHNYVLPPQVVGDVLADMGNVLSCVKFLTEYDIGLGSKLESLDSLPVEENGENRVAFFSDFDFEKIIPMIEESVVKSRTMVIQIEGREMLYGLMTEIYRCLPEYVKHLLGVCTYSREIVGKKGIHLVFVEKDVVQPCQGKLILRSESLITVEKASTVIDSRSRLNCLDALTRNLSVKNHLIIRIPTLSFEQFFREIAFWKARIKGLSSCEWMQEAEQNWLDAMLECLTSVQLAAIPGEFINCGKAQSRSEIYVILGILKTVSGALNARILLDLRYFIGSYPLSHTAYARVIQNVRRIYSDYITPQNDKNIEFLFRSRNTGELDASGLAAYMEEFSSSITC